MLNLVERAPGAGRPGSLERELKKTTKKAVSVNENSRSGLKPERLA
jgi:hypothetical protein